MPRGSAPGEHRGGRKKGTPNKFSAQLRDMILAALAEAGGEAYLRRQAEENPGAFMILLGKVLPTTIRGGSNADPVRASVELRFVD